MSPSRVAAATLSVGLMVVGAGVVSGQDYPNKPIRVIAGTAGGGGDFTARIIAQGIAGPLGQPVVVDNRGPLLAGEAASKAPPDGYTLLVSGGVLWISPLLRKTSYDVMSDFSPISLLVREINVLVVHPSVPVKSVKELIALAKARPGELNYASTATASTAHLAGELFKSMAGVSILHIPYKGTGPAISALVSGEVQLAVFDTGVVVPQLKSGKLRALAITSAGPSALTPGLPTIAASGLPGYEMESMTGLFGPGRTPVAIVNRLHQEVIRVLNQPDVKQRYLNAGSEIVGSSPEQFAAAVKADMGRLGKVIKDAGIKVD